MAIPSVVVEVPGPQGPPGDPGDPGPKGDPGAGVPSGGTTGQILGKASAADHDTTWVDQSIGGGWAVSIPPTTTLVHATVRANSTGPWSDGRLILMPMKLLQRTYTGIGIRVMSAGTADPAPVVRLGIYYRNPDGTVVASAPEAEAAPISVGTTGVKWETIDFTPTSPDVYVACLLQGDPTGLTVPVANNNNNYHWGGTVLHSNGENQGFYMMNGVTSGGLPAPPTPTTGNGHGIPQVLLR